MTSSSPAPPSARDASRRVAPAWLLCAATSIASIATAVVVAVD